MPLEKHIDHLSDETLHGKFFFVQCETCINKANDFYAGMLADDVDAASALSTAEQHLAILGNEDHQVYVGPNGCLADHNSGFDFSMYSGSGSRS